MNKQTAINLKQTLKSSGLQLLQARMDAAEYAMQQAQEAANNEAKSSVGDKYETARSMAQMDKDMNMRQLEAARQQYSQLQNIRVDVCQDSFVPGAVARIGEAYYFLSVGLGNVDVEGKKVWYLSAHAPFSRALLNKKAGDTILVQGKSSTIEVVF
ncbi:MAG: hypothetical protein U0T77_09305 [Chitinophagales bacterium]